MINSDRILQGSNLERENEGNKEEGDFRFDKVKNRIKEDGRIEVSYLTLRRSVWITMTSVLIRDVKLTRMNGAKEDFFSDDIAI